MSNEREAFEVWWERVRDEMIQDTDPRRHAEAAWQAARQSAGANETTLRVLSSHAIRKHEGVTIFGDPAQVLKVMAAIEGAAAKGESDAG